MDPLIVISDYGEIKNTADLVSPMRVGLTGPEQRCRFPGLSLARRGLKTQGVDDRPESEVRASRPPRVYAVHFLTAHPQGGGSGGGGVWRASQDPSRVADGVAPRSTKRGRYIMPN